MFYLESSRLTVSGFNLAGQIYAYERQVKYLRCLFLVRRRYNQQSSLEPVKTFQHSNYMNIYSQLKLIYTHTYTYTELKVDYIHT